MGYFDGETPKVEKTYTTTNTTRATKSKGKAIGWVLNNSSIIFILILLALATLVLFTANIDFNTLTFKKRAFSGQTLFLAVTSYLLFLNGFRQGGNAFRETENYTGVLTEYKDLIDELYKKNLTYKLDDFCEWWVKNELENARKILLQPYNLTIKDYNDIVYNGVDKQLTDEQKAIIERCKKIKPLKLTKEMILSPKINIERFSLYENGKKVKWLKIYYFTLKAVTLAFTSAFVVSIGYRIFLRHDLETVINSCMELGLLIFSVLGGIRGGSKVENATADYISNIIYTITEFNIWLKNTEKGE